MKRFLLLSSFLMLVVFPVLAQIKVGVKAGVDWRSHVYKNTLYGKIKHSGHQTTIGIFSTIPVCEKVYIRPEFIFATRPVYDYITDPDWGFYGNLNFPLLVGYKPIKKISVLAGPEFRYSPGRYIELGGYKRFEAGISGGFNYQFWRNFSLDAIYTHGLTDLVDREKIDWRDSVSPAYKGGRSRIIRLGLAYTFGKDTSL